MRIPARKIRSLLCSTLLLSFILQSVAAQTGSTPARPQSTPPAPPDYTISPSNVQQGKDYDVLLTSTQCLKDATKKPLKDVELYAPTGSGLSLSAIQKSNCNITAKISVAPDAPIANTRLWLKNTDPLESVELSVNPVTPGPMPPGLNGKGEVDVMWSVLPENVVHDNFGKKVSHEYYCIAVTIGNDSGYDLQISSVGFTIPELQRDAPENTAYRVPSISYQMVRGTLERAQQLGTRNRILDFITTMGPFLTGFTPFFHAINHRANFTEGVNIFSNPFEKGYERVLPDTTIRQLDRLADQTWRDDNSSKTIVQNNTQLRLMTFFPKQFLYPNPKDLKSKTAQTSTGHSASNSASSYYDRVDYAERKSPQAVMKRLGQIVLIGDIVQHTNRIRVVSNQLLPNVTDHPISGRITDACGIGIGGVEVTLSGTADFVQRKETTDSAGDYTFANVPADRQYSVSAKLANTTFSLDSGAPDSFILRDARSNVNFKAVMDPFVIKGKITRSGTTEPLKDVKVTLKRATGEQIGEVKTEADGTYKFEVKGRVVTDNFEITPALTNFTFEPSTQSWNCNKRDTDFRATEVTKKP